MIRALIILFLLSIATQVVILAVQSHFRLSCYSIFRKPLSQSKIYSCLSLLNISPDLAMFGNLTYGQDVTLSGQRVGLAYCVVAEQEP